MILINGGGNGFVSGVDTVADHLPRLGRGIAIAVGRQRKSRMNKKAMKRGTQALRMGKPAACGSAPSPPKKLFEPTPNSAEIA